MAWLQRWQPRNPRLTDWVEQEAIGETLTFCMPPRQHHKHRKSTNLLERLNEEIKRRTRVVHIFPNPASCRRLVKALCAETHEAWLEDNRYLDMALLKSIHRRRTAAAVARLATWRKRQQSKRAPKGPFFSLEARPGVEPG